MKLAKSCVIDPSSDAVLVLGHLTYAARKLWNVANYERKTWIKETEVPYPNWFEQKKRLKDHFWYRNLPSQSARSCYIPWMEPGNRSLNSKKQTGWKIRSLHDISKKTLT